MVLYVLGRAVKVCYTGILLENLFAFHHTTAYQGSLRMLCSLDRRQSKYTVEDEICRNLLTSKGDAYIDTMPTDPEILEQRRTWEMSSDADDVVVWSRDTRTLSLRSPSSSVRSLRFVGCTFQQHVSLL